MYHLQVYLSSHRPNKIYECREVLRTITCQIFAVPAVYVLIWNSGLYVYTQFNDYIVFWKYHVFDLSLSLWPEIESINTNREKKKPSVKNR